MISALGLTSKSLVKYNLFVLSGSDALLRDITLSLLGPFKKTIDAERVSTSEIAGLIEAPSISFEVGTVLVKNSELLKEDPRFDSWLHRKHQDKTIVLLVSVKEKLNPHYSRVVGRRGLIIDCDIPQDFDLVKRWVRDRAARRGVRLSPHMIAVLVERCGDLMVIDRLLDMLKFGSGGRVVTEGLLSSLIIGKGGGIPLIVEALFNQDKRGLDYTVSALNWGIDIDKILNMLIFEILMHIRVKELGPVRSCKDLKFDRRLIPVYFSRGSKVGLKKMWDMVESLCDIAKGGIMKEVLFLDYLSRRLILNSTFI